MDRFPYTGPPAKSALLVRLLNGKRRNLFISCITPRGIQRPARKPEHPAVFGDQHCPTRQAIGQLKNNNRRPYQHTILTNRSALSTGQPYQHTCRSITTTSLFYKPCIKTFVRIKQCKQTTKCGVRLDRGLGWLLLPFHKHCDYPSMNSLAMLMMP